MKCWQRIDIDLELTIVDDDREQMVEDNHNHLIFHNLMSVLQQYLDNRHSNHSIEKQITSDFEQTFRLLVSIVSSFQLQCLLN